MQTMEQYNHRWAAVEDEESKKNSKTQSDLKNLLRERLWGAWWRRGGGAVNSRTSDQEVRVQALLACSRRSDSRARR